MDIERDISQLMDAVIAVIPQYEQITYCGMSNRVTAQFRLHTYNEDYEYVKGCIVQFDCRYMEIVKKEPIEITEIVGNRERLISVIPY